MNKQHSGLPLPEGWVHTTIGVVCEFEKGKKPKNTGHRSDTRTVPYINIRAFESGIPEEYAEPGNYPMCSKHDVLIVWDGARSGLVGSGVSGYIGSTLSKAWSQSTENKYLFYFLKSQYGYINTNTKGVGIPHVDPGILNAIEIPIAPPDQQKRIVSEIEKQFSRLDEAVAALKRIQANLKRYKAAVLKAAVEGKLSEQWREEHPDVEPASELLKRILTERRKKWEEDYVKKYLGAHGRAPKDNLWKRKYKEPVAPDTSNLPKLPKGWVWATPEQLDSGKPYALAIVPFGSNLKVSDYRTKGFPLIFVRNIRSQRGAYFVTVCAWNKECLFGGIKDGEILLNEYGEIGMKCWNAIPGHFVYVETDEFIVMPNHVHGIITITNVGAQFIAPSYVDCHTSRHSAINQNNQKNVINQGVINHAPTVGGIVRSFKARCTYIINQIRNTPGTPVWQRNYYEHIIRDDRDLRAIREYIRYNPLKWSEDEENPEMKGTI